MILLTPTAISKTKEIIGLQSPPLPVALRVGVRGGGCSGFQYALEFAHEIRKTDEVLEFDGLKVVVDQMSAMYLADTEIDFVETLVESGFKFNNPNVKRTCGCGSSFDV
jgi:iron-sulfur cluster assembly accessory protein